MESDIREKYNRDSEFSLKIRSFSGLAFLSIETVEQVYVELKDDEVTSVEYIAYFDIGVVKRRGAKLNYLYSR